MWWCCGKQQKDALGCKYGRHVKHADEEEEVGSLEGTSKVAKCLLCRRVGHSVKECPNDPNIKTGQLYEIEGEFERV